jgi:hypothetical protein
VLTNEEKNRFIQIIKNLQTPTGYVFSLKKKVHIDGEVKGMKSHDDARDFAIMHVMPYGKRM